MAVGLREMRTKRYLPEGLTCLATVYAGIFILTALSPTHTSIAWLLGYVYTDGSGSVKCVSEIIY
jgi:hypothetical protein